ncbi:hypothetical protein GCM10027059_18330 [Myceligenerans halotolerans]
MTNFAGAVPGPDGRPLDQIRITGVNGRGRHGVLASERATGQEFRADVVLYVDTRPAAEGDDLRATVSYADVAQEAHDVLVGEPVDLIETLAERIAAVALGHDLVQAVDVTVHKPQAPIPVSFTDVEVSIRRDRVAVPPVVGSVPFAAAADDRRPAEPAGRDAPASEFSFPAEEPAETSEPTTSGTAAPAVDPLTAPIGDLTTDDAEPAGWSAEPAANDAPVSAENLVIPEITPAEPAPAGEFGAQPADFGAQPAVFDEPADPADQVAPVAEPATPEPAAAQPQDAGMIDAVPPAGHGVPAFEPHADAPTRPVDDGSTARRPAYDSAAAQASAPFAAPVSDAQAPETPASGAEQYEPARYESEEYQREQYRPEAYQPEVYQPEYEQNSQQQFRPEQGQQAAFGEQAPFGEQADPAFAGQAQQGFAEQPAPAAGVGQGSAPEDRLDQVPAEPVEVVLALGANLGDPQATLRAAVMDLDRITGLQVTEVSPLARTAAVGGPEQPDYLNAVVVARTGLAPRELLHACQAIEYAHGRSREEHWGPRTLDIDIITYGLLTAAADDLEVPHPRAHERAFVLEPWSQLKPDAVLPGLGGGPVAQLAATAEDRQGIRWLALDWLTESHSGADPTGDVEPQPTASHRPYDPPAQPQQHTPPAQDQQAADQHVHQDLPPRDQVFHGGPGQQPGQGQADPYQQQPDQFQPPGPYQQSQNGAPPSHPQGFPPDSVQYQQAPGSVPPPEEALVPAPQAPSADHPAARAPHTPPAAPLVPPAVRETARQDVSAEQVPVEPVHPMFAPVRPQPGDVPFAPVHAAPVDQQSAQPAQPAQPADDRPAWAPVRSDEHGHRG